MDTEERNALIKNAASWLDSNLNVVVLNNKTYVTVRDFSNKEDVIRDFKSILEENISTEELEDKPDSFLELGCYYRCIEDWCNRELYKKGTLYICKYNAEADFIGLNADDGNCYPWPSEDVFNRYFIKDI